jgi:hypothetical protein
MAQPKPSKSPILASIQQLTHHPEAASTESLQSSAWPPTASVAFRPKGLKPLKARRSSGRHAGTFLSAAAGAVLILAASKLVARAGGLRDGFQAGWAQLETRASASVQATTRQCQQAVRTVKAQQHGIKRELRRFAPLVLGVLAASVAHKMHRRSEERVIARGERPPGVIKRLLEEEGALAERVDAGFLRRAATLGAAVSACAVAQSAMVHRPAVGVDDKYRRLRRQATTHSRTVAKRCELAMHTVSHESV